MQINVMSKNARVSLKKRSLLITEITADSGCCTDIFFVYWVTWCDKCDDFFIVQVPVPSLLLCLVSQFVPSLDSRFSPHGHYLHQLSPRFSSPIIWRVMENTPITPRVRRSNNPLQNAICGSNKTVKLIVNFSQLVRFLYYYFLYYFWVLFVSNYFHNSVLST